VEEGEEEEEREDVEKRKEGRKKGRTNDVQGREVKGGEKGKKE
jgi:hypothetical protein